MESQIVTKISQDPSDHIELKIWKDKKILIRKSLIPIRIAQFFWFGSAKLNEPFFSLLLTHKGLSIEEFSSAFFLIFLGQLILGYMCGIIVDKLGNVKHVLLFNMVATITIVICFLLAPNISNASCSMSNPNITYLDASGNYTNLSYFNYTYSENKQNNILYQEFSKLFNSSTNSSLNLYAKVHENMNRTNEELCHFLDVFDTTRNVTCACLRLYQSSTSSIPRTVYRAMYSVLIIAFFSFWGITHRFLDLTAFNLVKGTDSSFGKEFFFGVLGETSVILLLCLVLNVDKSNNKDYYDNIYWAAVALMTLSAVAVCNIKSIIHPQGENVLKNSLMLVKEIKIIIFLFVVLIAGNGFAVRETFRFLFLENLEAPKAVYGLQLMASSIYGLPFLFWSKAVVERIGEPKLLVSALLAYSLNAVSYSFLYQPWLSLVLEVTEIFSYHLFWVAMVLHSQTVSPEGLSATTNAVAGSVHYGMGRSFGVTVGGLLVASYGMRIMFRVLASVCLVTAIFYAAYLRFFTTSRNYEVKGNDKREKIQMEKKTEEEFRTFKKIAPVPNSLV